ncbi:MAG: hypothetical protein Q4C72_07455 [Eubacteriales bacterium]|nr:hypothetical protein [Eubacteriales bacterium]
MKRLVIALLLAALCVIPAAAVTEEDVQNVGGDALTDAMPDEQRAYLDGIRPETADDLAASMGRLLENAASDGRTALQSALHSLVCVAAVIILTAAARGFSAAAGGESNIWIDMAGALGCAGVLLRDFTGVLALCRDTLEQISLFSATLQPVLATVLSVGGSAATATVLQVAAMVVFDLVIRLINTLLVPAACAYLAIIVVDAATGGEMLHGIADGIKSLTSGALKLILTLFTAYLTIAGGISGNVDRMTLKTAKFAVSGAVPVVGGVISDATETMLSGAALLKSSIGVFGMLCVTAICLVPFLRAGASYLCYRAGAAVLSPLCSGSLRQLLNGMGTGFGLLLGMLSTCCVILYLELVYVVAMVKPI